MKRLPFLSDMNIPNFPAAGLSLAIFSHSQICATLKASKLISSMIAASDSCVIPVILYDFTAMVALKLPHVPPTPPQVAVPVGKNVAL